MAAKLIVQSDGMYMDAGDGVETKLDQFLIRFDEGTGDAIIKFAGDVEVRQQVDPFAAYNFGNPEVRRIALAEGIVTEAQLTAAGL